MAFEIDRVDVWAGEVRDRRGALADMLKGVLDAGADLDFVLVRPSPVKSGTGILYIAPLTGPEQIKAAEEIGLAKSSHIEALRITGPDRQGLTVEISRALADAGVSISGLTGGRMGDRCVLYIRFESHDDVDKAAEVVTALLE